MRVGLYTARFLGEAVANIVAASGVEVVGRQHTASGWWGTAGTDHDDDVFAANPDIVVSCLTDHLFTQSEIDAVPIGIVNLHPAPLPRYRGCNSYSHAIINGDRSYGVTLHKVDAGIDTGDIIDGYSFAISPHWTARMVHDRAQVWAAYVFASWWTDVIDGWHGDPHPQRGVAGYYRRDSLDVYRKLADHPPEMHDRIRRALTFPPFPMPEEP